MHVSISASAALATFAILVGALARAAAQEPAMPMQPGAERMKVSVRSPANGTRITDDVVRIRVSVSGFHDSCELAGTPNREGEGHYHVLLDKSLVNMFCTDASTVSLRNVTPGTHTLAVVPAQNDHAEVEGNAQTFTINYAPKVAPPAVTGAPVSGQLSIKILSPKSGATLSGPFDVTVAVSSNFRLSCELFGKPDVPGYGHWHLNYDRMTGPMMGMMTMAGMSCSKTFRASTAGLDRGSTHTLIALLADNEHAPLHPVVIDSVSVKIR